jgi:zinc transporter ZupT
MTADDSEHEQRVTI